MLLIGVGANLPGPTGLTSLETCLAAVDALRALRYISVVAVSNWWQSSPIPPSDQPQYVNGVIGLCGEVGPEKLLSNLKTIEKAFGRQRGAINAARTLDLDIIAMGNIVRDKPDPVLPHPRAHLRAFVLRPLLDIAPDWVHPVFNKTAAHFLSQLNEQSCVRMPL